MRAFDAGSTGELASLDAILLRSESASSSQIENLTASARAVAEAEVTHAGRGNAALVVANVEAMVAAVELADRLGVGPYLRERFMFAGTPDEVEAQLRAAVGAGARNFDGAIDADQPEHERRITTWAQLVLPRFTAGPGA